MGINGKEDFSTKDLLITRRIIKDIVRIESYNTFDKFKLNFIRFDVNGRKQYYRGYEKLPSNHLTDFNIELGSKYTSHDAFYNLRNFKKFLSILDEYEQNDWTLMDFIYTLKLGGMTKRYIFYFCPGTLGDNIKKINRTMNHRHENEMLANAWVTRELKLEFTNTMYENIYLFGKHKKRPGGKTILVCRVSHDIWSTEYWSRQMLKERLHLNQWFIFKQNEFYYAISMYAYATFPGKNFDMDNIDNANKLNDYSGSEDFDFGDPIPSHPPAWLFYHSEFKCGYCSLHGHLQENCCVQEADLQYGNLNKENEIPQKTKENIQHEKERIFKKKGNSLPQQRSNTRCDKNKILIDTNVNNYQEKSFDPTSVSKFSPEFLKVKEDVVMIDKFGLQGKLDCEEQKMYNDLRDRTLVIIGQIPEVRNFKFNRMLTMPLFSLINLATVFAGGRSLPTNFNFLNTNFFDFNKFLGPLSLAAKFGVSLGGAAKQTDWIEQQFTEVQKWKYVKSIDDLTFDGRPDSQRSNALNHTNTRETEFMVSSKLTSDTVAGKFLLKTNKMIKKHLPRLHAYIGIETNIILGLHRASLEVATNQVTPSVDPLTSTFKDAESRIHRAVNSTMNINYDKDAELNDNYLIKNTCKLATVISGRGRSEKISPKTSKVLRRNVIRGYRIGEVKLPNINGLPLGENIFFSECKVIPGFMRPVLAANLVLKVNFKMPQPDTEDPKTTVAGLMKRICPKMPKPNRDRLAQIKLFTIMEMKRLFQPISPDSDTGIDAWLDKTCYSDARKAELRNAYLNIQDKFADAYKRVPGFVKLEGYNEPKLPRGIYSRTDEFKALVGPYFKLMEEIIYGLPEFIKHVPVSERASVVERDIFKDGCRYMSSDYTSYESSFSLEIMEAIEFPLYEYLLSLLPEGKEIFKLIKDTLGGVNCISFKYVNLFIEARRMSGEMCTSLGNGWTNYIVTTFLFWENGEKARMKVEGDDGLTRIEKYCPTEKDYEELGFKIKIDIYDDVSQASFCGMIYDKDDRAVIKNPFDVIADFFWVDRRYVNASPAKHLELLRSKSLSLLYSYPGCPILSAMAEWLCRMTQHIKPNHDHMSSYMREVFHLNEKFLKTHSNVLSKSVGINTRVLMHKKYGIDTADQLKLEAYFRNKTQLDNIDHEVIQRYMNPMYFEFYNHYAEENVNVMDDYEMLACAKTFGITDTDMENLIILDENKLETGLKDKNPIATRGQEILFARSIKFPPEDLEDHVPFPKPNDGIVEDDSSFDEPSAPSDWDTSSEILETPTAPNMNDDELKYFGRGLMIKEYLRSKLEVLRRKLPWYRENIIIEEKEEDPVHKIGQEHDLKDLLFHDWSIVISKYPILKMVSEMYKPFTSLENFAKFLFGVDQLNYTTLGMQAGIEAFSIYKFGLKMTLKGNLFGFCVIQGIKLLKLLISRTNSNYGNTNGLRYMSVQYREKNKGGQLGNNLFITMNNKQVRNKRLLALKNADAIKRRKQFNARNKKVGRTRIVRGRRQPLNRMNPRTFNNIPQNMKYVAPRQTTAGNKSRIIHREPLATINGSVGFNITTFQINPGLATTFPWLAPQALGYESYKINKLFVEYKFTTNEFTGKGRVVIAPDYDSADAPPTNILQAEQMVDSVMGAVAKNWTCKLRPRGIGILGPKRYTRSGALSANEDIKTYDVAQVHICTQGQTDGAEIGQTWLNYDITLFEPQPPELSNIFLSGSLLNDDGSGAVTTNLMGTDAQHRGAIGISHVNNVYTITNLVQGYEYSITLVVKAAVVTGAPDITYDATNLVLSNVPVQTISTAATEGIYFAKFISNDTNGQLTLQGVTVLTTPNFCSLTIDATISTGAE